jgi:hypothetical protein
VTSACWGVSCQRLSITQHDACIAELFWAVPFHPCICATLAWCDSHLCSLAAQTAPVVGTGIHCEFARDGAAWVVVVQPSGCPGCRHCTAAAVLRAHRD